MTLGTNRVSAAIRLDSTETGYGGDHGDKQQDGGGAGGIDGEDEEQPDETGCRLGLGDDREEYAEGARQRGRGVADAEDDHAHGAGQPFDCAAGYAGKPEGHRASG